jgi:hypothetical protein
MRPRRWWWIVVVALLLGACTARYVSLGPEAHHRFDVGHGEIRDMPLVSPTLLGWILPGDRTPVESAQFSPDGQWLYLSSSRGIGDELASATVSRPKNSVLVVDLRLITIPNLGRSAVGLYFGTRVSLDQTVDVGNPPIVRDAGTGDPVPVGPFIR